MSQPDQWNVHSWTYHMCRTCAVSVVLGARARHNRDLEVRKHSAIVRRTLRRSRRMAPFLRASHTAADGQHIRQWSRDRGPYQPRKLRLGLPYSSSCEVSGGPPPVPAGYRSSHVARTHATPARNLISRGSALGVRTGPSAARRLGVSHILHLRVAGGPRRYVHGTEPRTPRPEAAPWPPLLLFALYHIFKSKYPRSSTAPSRPRNSLHPDIQRVDGRAGGAGRVEHATYYVSLRMHPAYGLRSRSAPQAPSAICRSARGQRVVELRNRTKATDVDA
ncbi:hypothetical protein HYPSUDRAFT_206215 [Hypholoma sublateritium FD-334 SS-4]|uniref:Uncharacterized protein n=1 Tax=Hypholoma sublateritium (strain FD-334 SS-4) TaxID=945553 RepID=A0A0D2M2I8_HYPSF|nr:hypothetical protein HYPSUDRAFT_206215 [Hypholoma sublateritium FD-334 SS-4]